MRVEHSRPARHGRPAIQRDEGAMLPAAEAMRASVSLVQAIRVGVCSGGCGSAADALSEVTPRPRQIAFQRSRRTVLLESAEHDEPDQEATR